MNDFIGPDGKAYRLAHLKTTNYQVPLTSEGVRYIIPLVVSFSSHCFTDTRNKTVLATDPWFYALDHTGPRAFCHKRWESSKDLPANLGYLINENLGCFDAENHGKYLHLRNPNAKYPGNGWYVMFNLKQADSPALVHLGVASHHNRPTYPTNIKNRRTKPFAMVLEQWIRSKPAILKSLQEGVIPGTIPIATPENK